MKKLLFLAVTMLLAFTAFSQSGTTAYGFRPVMVVPDTSYKFPMQVKIGDLVYVSSTSTMYQLKIAVGITKNMNYVLASSARYGYPSVTITGASTVTGNLTVTGTASVGGQTLTADHTNDLKAANSLTATDTLFAPVVDATTKILLKSQVMTQDNINDVLFNNSITATDTIFAPTLSVSGNATLSGHVTGNSKIRGSANFTAALTRVAVSIPGATSSDYYVIRGIAADQYTRPIAADFMNCFAKTDSLIVMRAAGTTAGLGFTYFRIK